MLRDRVLDLKPLTPRFRENLPKKLSFVCLAREQSIFRTEIERHHTHAQIERERECRWEKERGWLAQE